MINYFTIPPPANLAAYVRFFWVLESDDPFYTHRSVADGCPELLFHYQGHFDTLLDNGKKEKSFVTGIHGQASRISRHHINENFGIFGVYLYPYAIPVLFGIPATCLTNQMVDLVTLLGTAGQELEEKILLAPDNNRRVNVITTFLESRLTVPSSAQIAIITAINLVLRTQGLIKIDTLAHTCCLSGRQFERKFKAYAGFTPKLFSRITRFQSTTSEYNNSSLALTDIALKYGYYDQSHFIQDFREFSGHKPKEYFYGEAEGTAWKKDE